MDEGQISAAAAAFQQGEEDALEALVDSLTRPLIAIAYRYTRDWEWARDLTQETWIQVHRQIDRYDTARPFRPWLYAIHRNGCLSHLRRAWVRHESTPGDEVVRELQGSTTASNPEADLERAEFHRRLVRALDALGERQREIFARVDLEGGDQKEVAQEMEMKFTTLRTTLHFARKRVAELLLDEERSP